ncbi:MAG: chemotaxis protein CheA [Nitrospirae bacterium]|nr:chemotaxis protein CheA [Nitrospirota bacterium]
MSETERDEMQEIIQDFLVETQEILDGLDEKFVELEKRPDDPDLLNSIFRGAHTIKGAAGFLGFTQMVELAHKTESLLNKLRNGEMSVTPPIMDVILLAVDQIKVLLGKIREHDQKPADLSGILARLEAAMVSGKAAGAASPAPVAQAAPAAPKAVSPPPPPLPSPGEKPIGEILVAEGKITREQLAEALDAQQKAPKLGEILVQKNMVAEDDVIRAVEKQSHAGAGVEQTIRVDTKRLDSVLDLVGELVLGRNRLAKIQAQFEGRNGDDPLVTSLGEVSSHINLITTDLQLAVMKTRMQPVRRVFSKFPRMVRDMGRAKGKEIELQVFGEETELDKSVIEEIGDPLVHLIRNAVDHGIEMPDARQAAGKPRKGTILLSAYHEGNSIIIEIEDDGKGIDHAVIRQKAVEKGAIDRATADRMTEREAINLIFAAGFSTAEKVSELSGRGVGMDVVKTNITKLNGIVEINTEVGKGTRMRIRLPLTVAIIQALMVEVGREAFAIPLATVVETIRIGASEIRTVDGREVISLRKTILPLIRLATEFGIETAGSLERYYVVVIAVGEKRFGVVVDRLRGQEEVVIKSVGEYLDTNDGIAGATITGDGKVVLILDMAVLIKNMVAQREQAGRRETVKRGNGE